MFYLFETEATAGHAEFARGQTEHGYLGSVLRVLNFSNSLSSLNSALSQSNPAQEISNLQNIISSMNSSMQAYANDFSKVKDLVSTDLKEITKNKKEIFKTIDDSQAALQKMYNNMANMSDLIVTKLKRK